jgi:hypothetical protein
MQVKVKDDADEFFLLYVLKEVKKRREEDALRAKLK